MHARGDTMKAIVQDRYGSPDVLEPREIDRPVNRDDEVLVRVHAAGVDQGVWHEVAGLPICSGSRVWRARAEEPHSWSRRGGDCRGGWRESDRLTGRVGP